jgi:ribosomal protein L7/L12
MKLIDYLRERHPRINALTRAEAGLLGISYPLVSGWVDRHGDMELSPEKAQELKDARAKRYAKKSYQKAKAKSVRRRKADNPAQPLGRETKKQKAETQNSLTKLVKTIVHTGCKDAKRLEEHLNQPHRKALHKEHAKNMQHMKSI